MRAFLLAAALLLSLLSGCAWSPPSNPDTELARGWQALGEQRWRDAEAAFEAAVELAPERAEGHLGLGEARFWLRRPALAVAAYRAALARQPGLPLAENGLGHSLLQFGARTQDPLLRRKLLDEADQAFGRALALAPDFAPARDGLAAVAAERPLVPKRTADLVWLTPLAMLLVAALAACHLGRALRARRLRQDPAAEVAADAPSPRVPLRAFLVSRALILLLAWTIPGLLVRPPGSWSPLEPSPGNPAFETLAGRWDSNFYLRIARDGYEHRYPPTPEFTTAGYFPLLPVLARLLGGREGAPDLAGLLLANGALLAAAILFHRAAAAQGTAAADQAVWYWLIFPASFYGSAFYAESLMLLGAIAALVAARRGHWTEAGLWGVFAGLARPSGILVVPMLAAEWWTQRRGGTMDGQPRRAAALAAAGPLLGIALFALYTWQELGDVLAYPRENGRRALGGVLVQTPAMLAPLAGRWWRSLLAGDLPWRVLLGVAALLLVSAAAVWLLRRRQWAEAAFVLAGIGLALMSDVNGQLRYLWILFPAFLPLAHAAAGGWRRRTVEAAFIAGLVLNLALFAAWYFPG